MRSKLRFNLSLALVRIRAGEPESRPSSDRNTFGKSVHFSILFVPKEKHNILIKDYILFASELFTKRLTTCDSGPKKWPQIYSLLNSFFANHYIRLVYKTFNITCAQILFEYLFRWRKRQNLSEIYDFIHFFVQTFSLVRLLRFLSRSL